MAEVFPKIDVNFLSEKGNLTAGLRHKTDDLLWIGLKLVTFGFELNGLANMLLQLFVAAAGTQDVA